MNPSDQGSLKPFFTRFRVFAVETIRVDEFAGRHGMRLARPFSCHGPALDFFHEQFIAILADPNSGPCCRLTSVVGLL